MSFMPNNLSIKLFNYFILIKDCRKAVCYMETLVKKKKNLFFFS